MAKKLIVFLVLISLSAVCMTPLAFASGVTEICLKQINPENGNIYFDNDSISFLCETVCNRSIPYQVMLTYTVTDGSGSTVWSKSENKVLSPKSKTSFSVSPDIDRYGIFTLNVELSGSYGTSSASAEFALAAYNNDDNGIIGVQTHFSNFTSDYEKEKPTMYLTGNSGITWTRDDIRWMWTETKKNEYKIQESREKNVDNLLASGNNVLLILSFLNPLYDNGEFPKSEDGINAYANFCKYTVEYFKGRVSAFEIGNEPDLEAFTVRDISGDEYARVLKRARDAIKEVDENIIVVGGSFCSHRSEHNKEFLTQFADEVNKNGGWKNYMDYVSYHPYSSDGNYSDEVSVMTFLQNFDYVRQQLGSDIPVWITE